MPKEGVKTTPFCGLLWIIFCTVLIPPISFAYLFLSIKGIFWHYTPLYPWQVKFVRSWNISDSTDKPTRSSSVIRLVLSTRFYWARTSYKPRPLPVCEQLIPRPLLFLVSLNILDIKYSMLDGISVDAKLIYGTLKVPATICPLPVWNQLRPRPLLFLLLLNILGIKYSMYDDILLG